MVEYTEEAYTVLYNKYIDVTRHQNSSEFGSAEKFKNHNLKTFCIGFCSKQTHVYLYLRYYLHVLTTKCN